jgi:hypothetical protein
MALPEATQTIVNPITVKSHCLRFARRIRIVSAFTLLAARSTNHIATQQPAAPHAPSMGGASIFLEAGNPF